MPADDRPTIADALVESAGCTPIGPDDRPPIPTGRGVVALEDADGATVAILAAARMRDRIAARLADHRGGPLRDAAARAVWNRVGSAFAADLVFLDEVRHRAPAVHDAAADRWQSYLLRIDPAARAPRWEKATSRSLTALVASGDAVLGPFADKHAAGRAMETLDDLFDLCRYPDELARAPNGRACAYHEMGKCPAACDGSEPLDTYRGRVREAAAFVELGVERGLAQREREMKRAAEDLDFETAERLRRIVDASEGLTARGARWARSIERFRFLAVSRCSAKDWALITQVDGGRVRVLGACAAGGDAAPIIRSVSPPEPRRPMDQPEADAVGLIATWLYDPKHEARGGVAFIRLEPDADPTAEVGRAVRRILNKPDADEADRTMELL